MTVDHSTSLDRISDRGIKLHIFKLRN